MKHVPLERALTCVGRGWAPLVAHVYGARDAIEGQVNIIQVKEKWGGLRIYTDVINDKLDIIRSKAELDSFHVCEECGAPGCLRKGSTLYLTRCEQHADGAIPI